MSKRVMGKKTSRGSFKTTGAVMIVIFVSKAIGMIRDIIQAQYFGRGAAADAYNAAYMLFYLPILLFSSCISSTLVPMYIRIKERNGPQRADWFASNVTNVFLLLAFVLSGIMMAFAEPMLRLIVPGYAEETLVLAADLTRVMMPSLIFVVLSLVLSTILNAQEHYVAAQLTGFPLSGCVIIAAILFADKFGIYAIAWGVFFAGIFQALIQIPPLSKSFRYTMALKLNDPKLKRLFILAGPAILSMAVNELNHMVDNGLASGLGEGAVSALTYAYKLIAMISGIIVVPLTTILFSKMSMRFNKVGKKGIIPIIKKSMETMAAVLLPIMAISMAFSREIIMTVFMRNAFTLEDAIVTGDVFLFYVVGLLAFAYRDIINRAFHAAQDTRTPMSNAFFTMLISIGLNFPLREIMGVNGIALSTSIASIIGTSILLIRLRKHTGRMGLKNTAAELLKIGIASAICAYVSLALNRFVPGVQGMIMNLLRIGMCSVAALAVYGMTLFVLNSRQLNFLKQRFKS